MYGLLTDVHTYGFAVGLALLILVAAMTSEIQIRGGQQGWKLWVKDEEVEEGDTNNVEP